jgi:asparagine synthase (glutamine-hydrolysing)
VSGIYGLYRYDGAPVEHDWLERMRAAMAYYGPQGGGSEIAGPLGLGHLLMEFNPEDAFECQPVIGSRGLVASAARLDNRADLLETFHVSTQAACSMSDGHLIGLAFDRWGEDVVKHLQGDWALAGWDRRERRLLLARDACGNATLYYHEGKGFIAFASSMKALLALPGVAREPDPLRLAQVLASWQHDAELTAYKNFRRLLQAHSLTVGPEGQSRCRRYWSPENLGRLTYRRDEEYEEAFLEHYGRAVQSCLRTQKPVAALLSGGRDSGSVVAMAAPLLARQGRDLTAYTSVPFLPPDGAGDSTMGNEWETANATAAMAGANVRHVPIHAAEYGVLQGIEHFLDLHDGPSHAASNHYWLQAVSEAAMRNGAGAVLSGQFGNATVSWSGNGSALLALLQGYPDTAMQLLFHAEPNPWLTLKRQVLKPLLTPALRRFRRLKSSNGQPWRDYSALNPQMARKVDLDSRMRASGYDATFTFSPLKDCRIFFFDPDWSVATGMWSEMSARHGVAFLDPTSNLALVEFLLRVPDSQFRRHGQGSSLFRRSFRNRLPEQVLEGRLHGLQAADVGHRVLKELPAVRQCMDSLSSLPAANEYLDMPLLNRCLQDLINKVDPDTTGRAGTILLRGLGVGMFLLRVAESG